MSFLMESRFSVPVNAAVKARQSKKAKNVVSRNRRPVRRSKSEPTRTSQRDALVHEARLRTESHLRMTIEDWRIKKRQEWRTVMSALQLFSYGSAYTPASHDLYVLQHAADRIRETMEEDWVCW